MQGSEHTGVARNLDWERPTSETYLLQNVILCLAIISCPEANPQESQNFLKSNDSFFYEVLLQISANSNMYF